MSGGEGREEGGGSTISPSLLFDEAESWRGEEKGGALFYCCSDKSKGEFSKYFKNVFFCEKYT